MESLLRHPPNYVKKQVSRWIKNNDITKEIVWTYLVARKYETDHKTLSKILCGQDEEIPDDSKIWIEAILKPTRQNEGDCWKTRADLSMGHLEKVERSKIKIRSNGSWVCICEAKWNEDLHYNKKYKEINQLAQLIEHAMLLHNKKAIPSKRVYVTLITPKSFREQRNRNQYKNYQDIFTAYKEDKNLIVKDLQKCDLKFKDYDDYEPLIGRVSGLNLNWVTFEKLLGLSDLLKQPRTWKEVLIEMGREDLFDELTK